MKVETLKDLLLWTAEPHRRLPHYLIELEHHEVIQMAMGGNRLNGI